MSTPDQKYHQECSRHLQHFSSDSGITAKLFQFAVCEWKVTGKTDRLTDRPPHNTEK